MAFSNNNADDDLVLAKETVGCFVFPMVFKAAIELDLLEIIGKAGADAQISPVVVASQLQTQNPDAPEMVDRIMRYLASYSWLTCSLITHDDGHIERLYGLAPVSTYFLANHSGPFSGVFKALNHKDFLYSWQHLKDAVLEGGTPFNKAHGISVYDYAASEPNFNESFNTGMLLLTSTAMREILEKYRGFENAKVVVDVGGGIGATIHLITSKYPKIEGINFDLPHVIQNTPTYPGVQHVGGDMFVSVPTGDIIILKRILHNWGDDHCLKLLKICYEALPEHGKVVVIDRILPLLLETTLDAKLMFRADMIMLAHHPGGKERTEKEFENLAKVAGFIGLKLVCFTIDLGVMEFYKSHIQNQPKIFSSNNANDDLVLAEETIDCFVFPMVFKAAIELDLLEIIGRAGADAQISPVVVATQLQTQNPDAPEMVDRIMRYLASYSWLTCSLITHDDGRVERLYGLTPVSTYFLANHSGPLSGIFKALNHKEFLDSWQHLKDAILEGGTPFNKAHGISLYDYATSKPSFNDSFNTAMLLLTSKAMREILEKYKGFENAKVIVDVGGGIGATIHLITSKYPNIEGINFDLPHVIQNAPTYPGVQHVGGDMFVSIPTGDIIILKKILHNWGDDHCLKLLKICYEALPEHGKMVVIERLLPLFPETTLDAKLMFQQDMIMLAYHGGKERTEREFENLAKVAGFIGLKLVCSTIDLGVMEFYKSHM